VSHLVSTRCPWVPDHAPDAESFDLAVAVEVHSDTDGAHAPSKAAERDWRPCLITWHFVQARPRPEQLVLLLTSGITALRWRDVTVANDFNGVARVPARALVAAVEEVGQRAQALGPDRRSRFSPIRCSKGATLARRWQGQLIQGAVNDDHLPLGPARNRRDANGKVGEERKSTDKEECEGCKGESNAPW